MFEILISIAVRKVVVKLPQKSEHRMTLPWITWLVEMNILKRSVSIVSLPYSE